MVQSWHFSCHRIDTLFNQLHAKKSGWQGKRCAYRDRFGDVDYLRADVYLSILHAGSPRYRDSLVGCCCIIAKCLYDTDSSRRWMGGFCKRTHNCVFVVSPPPHLLLHEPEINCLKGEGPCWKPWSAFKSPRSNLLVLEILLLALEGLKLQ